MLDQNPRLDDDCPQQGILRQPLRGLCIADLVQKSGIHPVLHTSLVVSCNARTGINQIKFGRYADQAAACEITLLVRSSAFASVCSLSSVRNDARIFSFIIRETLNKSMFCGEPA